MIPLTVIFVKVDDPPVWPEVDRSKLLHSKEPVKIAVIEKGMTSGAPSVAIRVDLADGQVIINETSAKLFVMAAKMIEARFGALD